MDLETALQALEVEIGKMGPNARYHAQQWVDAVRAGHIYSPAELTGNRPITAKPPAKTMMLPFPAHSVVAQSAFYLESNWKQPARTAFAQFIRDYHIVVK